MRRRTAGLALAALLAAGVVAAGAPLRAQTPSTTLVSADWLGRHPLGTQGRDPAISADGRFVAFASTSGLVPWDDNGRADVYVYDRLTTRLSLESSSAFGAVGDDGSDDPDLSADGRHVAFASRATNLVDADANGAQDIFVRDRLTGSVVRVSVTSAGAEATANSSSPSISADGRYVAFESFGDLTSIGDAHRKVFVHDRDPAESGTFDETVLTLLASRATAGVPNADSSRPAISADGNVVAFESLATNLDATDANGKQDIFAFDVSDGTVEVVARGTSSESGGPSASADGNLIAFWTGEDFAAADSNGRIDVYARDRSTGGLELVSIDTSGVAGGADSAAPAVSADGRFVAFVSSDDALVELDDNGTVRDVFLRDRSLGLTRIVSLGAAGEGGNGPSTSPSISEDGRLVGFESEAQNLTPEDGAGTDVFVRDDPGRAATILVSVTTGPAPHPAGQSYGAVVAQNGRFVAFVSDANDLVSGDTGFTDVFVRDLARRTTQRVSVPDGGVGQAEGDSDSASISADGRYVAFASEATNLPGSGADTNNKRDVFVHDLLTRDTVRVSELIGEGGAVTQSDGDSSEPSISSDGKRVAYTSLGRTLPGAQMSTSGQTFVRDLSNNSTVLLSASSSGLGGNGRSHGAAISGDGMLVAFASAATDLVAGDTNVVEDVFVRNIAEGTTALASLGFDGRPADGPSGEPVISGDGSRVGFQSGATNLVPGDGNGFDDVFVRDVLQAVTERVSLSSLRTEANGASFEPAISLDGRHVAFYSSASNLDVGQDDSNGTQDVFVRDTSTGTTARVSVQSDGGQANDRSRVPSISSNGDVVAFESFADNLAPGKSSETRDVFARVRALSDCPGGGRVDGSTAPQPPDGGRQDPLIQAGGCAAGQPGPGVLAEILWLLGLLGLP